jgi:hypothetical protein
MKHLLLLLILCIGIPAGAGAQTFTQRLQRQPAAGQGSVTIHQSDSIDQLVNSAMLTTKSSTTTTSTPRTAATQGNAGTKTTTTTVRTATAKTERQQEIVPDTLPKMIRGGHKVMGYRVQAFAGGNSRKDRQQAEQVRNSIKSHYPNVPVYVHFYSPRWICRVGNYRTYEEAHQMLVSLRELGFNQATIVKGKITIAY